MVGPVFKIDANIDGGRRGYFARLVVSVDLRKPLVSKIWINGKLQRVEYEALPHICFQCEKIRDGSENCLGDEMATSMEPLDGGQVNSEVWGLDKKGERDKLPMIEELRRLVAIRLDPVFQPWLIWKEVMMALMVGF